MTQDCLICRTELRTNPASLPCNHRFHYNCIEQWIRQSGSRATCPECGQKISPNSIKRVQASPAPQPQPARTTSYAPATVSNNRQQNPRVNREAETDAVLSGMLEDFLAEELAKMIIVGLAEEERRRREEQLRREYLEQQQAQAMLGLLLGGLPIVGIQQKPQTYVLRPNNPANYQSTSTSASAYGQPSPSYTPSQPRNPTYEVNSEIRNVTILKQENTLGVRIIGGEYGAPIFISHIYPNSTASANGNIKKGDVILKINGVDFSKATNNEAALVLKSLPLNSFVRFQLQYRPRSLNAFMESQEFLIQESAGRCFGRN